MLNARDEVHLSTRAIMMIVVTAVLVVLSFVFVAPIPQDPAYHNFADNRRLLNLDNFWNVVSNLPFLIVGIVGLAYVNRHARSVCLAGLQPAYWVLFTGVLTTAFGSSFYHIDPGNDALVWDRLPMTIAFAGLTTIIVGEFISVPLARRLIVPLLGVGFFSVVYWAVTESQGHGDLRPYAIVQFLPMLIIPIILYVYESAYGTSRYFWLMIMFYVIAKLFEYFDAQLYAHGQLLSGHSIKHIVASLTPATMLYALLRRRSAGDSGK